MTKDIWEDVYKKTDFDILVKRIKIMLDNPKLLYRYYPLARLLRKGNLKFNKSIELGAGTGQFSLILKKLGYIKEVYLVDVEEEALDIAKKLFEEFGEECNIINSNLLDLDYEKDSFDICFSGGLIEHFKGEEQEKVIKIHMDIAKKTIFQFPYSSITYWAMRKLITLKNKGWPFGYEKPLSKLDAKRLIQRKGIEIIDEDYHYLLPIVFNRITSDKIARCSFICKLFPFFKMDYIIYCRKGRLE